MSKRKFIIILATTSENTVEFFLDEVFNKFNDNISMEYTELAYTLQENVDTLLDLKENQVIHFYEDRDKEFPCLLKRVA